jgi:uncharacterized protein YjbJ (UPF0337 family)
MLLLLLLADVKGRNSVEALLLPCAIGPRSGLRKARRAACVARTVVDTSGPPADSHTRRDDHMGADDKIKNTAEKLAGQAKEGFGKATNDDEKVAEGRSEQSSASVKQAGENVKDVFK